GKLRAKIFVYDNSAMPPDYEPIRKSILHELYTTLLGRMRDEYSELPIQFHHSSVEDEEKVATLVAQKQGRLQKQDLDAIAGNSDIVFAFEATHFYDASWTNEPHLYRVTGTLLDAKDGSILKVCSPTYGSSGLATADRPNEKIHDYKFNQFSVFPDVGTMKDICTDIKDKKKVK
ncbi:MAG: hypothetical protein U9O94_09420, partial [Nanoarchaeota archaeon]|nr:hypothetical protein [Nanoarchaeota archaeon]